MMLLVLPALAGPIPLTYEDALRRAAERNPSVVQAEADVRAAEASRLAAGAPFGPTLDASGSFWGSIAESAVFGTQEASSESTGWFSSVGVSETLPTGTSLSADLESSLTRFQSFDLEGFDISGADDTYESTLSLSVGQALLQGVRLRYNLQGVRQAETALDAATLVKEARRQQAMADVASAYWALYYQRQLVVIAEQGLTLAKEQARVVAALVADGRLAAVEKTRIDAVVAESERGVLSARSAAAAAEDGLATLLGEAPGEGISLSSTPGAPPPVDLDEAAVAESVLAGNPELRALSLQADEAALALKDAQHARLPELGVSAGVELSAREESLSEAMKELSSGDLRGWNVGASLSVPLLNRADRGAAGAAEAEVARKASEEEALRQTLVVQARAQARAIEDARQQVELARLQQRLAEETFSAEQARFREGRTLQKDLIAASRDLDAAKIEVERALTDYQVAVVELQRLRGGL